MDPKPAQNIQDTFLNTVRKDKSPITIYLVSGVKLTGRIRSFDKYSVLLENNAQEQLIFKHAISTVCEWPGDNSRQRRARNDGRATPVRRAGCSLGWGRQQLRRAGRAVRYFLVAGKAKLRSRRGGCAGRRAPAGRGGASGDGFAA